MKNKQTYTGIIPPIVTPLTSGEALDRESLQKLISHCIDGGVSGLFVNGTSGEALRVSDSVALKCMQLTLEHAADKIPVFCGAIDSSTTRIIERLHRIENAGGKLAVCTPPFYLASFGQDEILRHYDKLCNSTKLNIAVYNIPETTHANILPETIARMADYENIVAYKDSTADWQQLQRAIMLLEEKDIAVLNGAEELCSVSMLCGAQGCIPGLANFVPQLFVKLQQFCQAGQVKEAYYMQQRINAVRKTIFVSNCWMSGMKGLLEIFGLGSRTTSLPLQQLTDGEMDEIRSILQACQVNI